MNEWMLFHERIIIFFIAYCITVFFFEKETLINGLLNNYVYAIVLDTCDPGYVAQFGSSESGNVSAEAETDQVNLLQRHVQASY